MTIEIHEPEIEALIQRQVESGAVRDAADGVVQALRSAPPSEENGKPKWPRSGADIVAAFRARPHKELEIEPERPHLPVREFSW